MHGVTLELRNAFILFCASLYFMAPLQAQSAGSSSTKLRAPVVKKSRPQSAELGFESQLANSSIGLYSEVYARGFSPKRNGSILLEGLFYRQMPRGGGFMEDDSVRVGINAQSYPFVPPGGLVDYQLIGEFDNSQSWAALAIHKREFEGYRIFYAGLYSPLKGKLTFALGANKTLLQWGGRLTHRQRQIYIVPKWRPLSSWDISAFYAQFNQYNSMTETDYYVPDGDLPHISPRSYTSPKWLSTRGTWQTMGIISKFIIDDWTIKSLFFHNDIFKDKQPQDTIYITEDYGTYRILRYDKDVSSKETGGEIRASKATHIGAWNLLSILSLRGYRGIYSQYPRLRLTIDDYHIGDNVDEPEPLSSFTPKDQMSTGYDETSWGFSQSAFYGKKLESNFSIRRTQTVYKLFNQYGALNGRNIAWLPSASLSWKAHSRLFLFTSLSRGIMTAKTAPNYAQNAGQLLPPDKTKQWDIGLRWKPENGGTFILSYFDLVQPYYELDMDDYYRQIAHYGRRGFEISYSKWLDNNIYLRAAAMLAPARIRDIDDNSKYYIYDRPSGVSNHNIYAYISYTPPRLKRLTLTASLDYNSKKYADSENLRYQPASIDANMGFNYEIPIGKKHLGFDFIASNLIQSQDWYAAGDDYYYRNPPRSFVFSASLDF